MVDEINDIRIIGIFSYIIIGYSYYRDGMGGSGMYIVWVRLKIVRI